MQSFVRAQAQVDLDAEVVRGVRKLALQENLTPFVTLLSAFKALLFRHTAEERVIVGSLFPDCMRQEAGGCTEFLTQPIALFTADECANYMRHSGYRVATP